MRMFETPAFCDGNDEATGGLGKLRKENVHISCTSSNTRIITVIKSKRVRLEGSLENRGR
jgi:hypothetical protein